MDIKLVRNPQKFDKAHDEKLCPFAKVVFACSKPKQGLKADPPQRVGISLGTAEVQDAWVIGDGKRVFFSRFFGG